MQKESLRNIQIKVKKFPTSLSLRFLDLDQFIKQELCQSISSAGLGCKTVDLNSAKSQVALPDKKYGYFIKIYQNHFDHREIKGFLENYFRNDPDKPDFDLVNSQTGFYVRAGEFRTIDMAKDYCLNIEQQLKFSCQVD